MGLQFSHFRLSLFLNIGQTSASFKSLGKFPCSRDISIIYLSGSTGDGMLVLRILLGILLDPHALDDLSSAIKLITSSLSTGYLCYQRNHWEPCHIIVNSFDIIFLINLKWRYSGFCTNINNIKYTLPCFLYMFSKYAA